MALPLVRRKTCGVGASVNEDGLSGGVMAGDYATNGFWHMSSGFSPAAFQRACLVHEFEWPEFLGDLAA